MLVIYVPYCNKAKMKLILLLIFISNAICPSPYNEYDPKKEEEVFMKHLFNRNNFHSFLNRIIEEFMSTISAIYKTFTQGKRPRRRVHNDDDYVKNPVRYARRLQEDSDEELDGHSSLYFTYMDKFLDEEDQITKYYAYNLTSPRSFSNHLDRIIPEEEDPTDCEHGNFVDVNYTIYKCLDTIVTKNEYERIENERTENETVCTVITRDGKACYCPSNYYGVRCESYIPMFCQYEMMYPTNEQVYCTESSISVPHDFYDNSRFGIPPCIFYNDGNFEVKAKLICKRHPSAVKGYKGLAQYIEDGEVEQDVEEPIEEPFVITNVLSVHNFVMLTKYAQFTENITYDTSNTNIINFPEVNLRELTELRYGGRWHIQIFPGIYNDGLRENARIVGQPIQFNVDDEKYVEPNSKSKIRWWVIFLIVLGSLVGVALIIIIIICLYRKKKAHEAFLKD